MPVTFLLVDDSAVIRLLLRKGLEREGIPPDRIFEAPGPKPALKTFRTEHPQVVFMDLTLQEPDPASPPGAKGKKPTPPGPPPEPVVGGEVVARTMMQEDPEVKIVVCTGAHDSDPRVRELVRRGAFYVMLKPVQIEHIRAFLQILKMELETRKPVPVAPRAPAGGA